jgi:hypothetical protein
MDRTLKANISKASYVMSFFLFRALEKVGMYTLTERMWDVWRELADQGCTTWVEDPVTQRSECHGWGALPLYEFPAVILGVRPGGYGYSSIQVKPHTGTLSQAKGTVCTARGKVTVDWKKGPDQFEIRITGPQGVFLEVFLPDGTRDHSTSGLLEAVCKLPGLYPGE